MLVAPRRVSDSVPSKKTSSPTRPVNGRKGVPGFCWPRRFAPANSAPRARPCGGRVQGAGTAPAGFSTPRALARVSAKVARGPGVIRIPPGMFKGQRYFRPRFQITEIGVGPTPKVSWTRGKSASIPDRTPLPPIFASRYRGGIDVQTRGLQSRGRASFARLQKPVAKPPFAHESSMGEIPRTTIRPLYSQSFSKAAPRVPFPRAKAARSWWSNALSLTAQ